MSDCLNVDASLPSLTVDVTVEAEPCLDYVPAPVAAGDDFRIGGQDAQDAGRLVVIF